MQKTEPAEQGLSASETERPPPLPEVLAWGVLAESIVAVCCPLVMHAEVDVTATALNLIGPLLGGSAQALSDHASEPHVSGADPLAARHTRRCCAAFQAGFIGAFTSFSFMAEQAAHLTAVPSLHTGLSGFHGHVSAWSVGWTYIAATVAASCAAFSAGRALLGALLRLQLARRPALPHAHPDRSGGGSCPPSCQLPPPRRLMRAVACLVAVAWLWALVSPAGSVYDPLELSRVDGPLHAGRPVPHLPLCHTSLCSTPPPVPHLPLFHTSLPGCSAPPSSPLAVRPSLPCRARRPTSPTCSAACSWPPQVRARKQVCKHARMQSDRPPLSAGLGASASVSGRAARGAVHWGPLACNGLACALLVCLRAAEAAGLPAADSIAAAKLRTSGCGVKDGPLPSLLSQQE